MYALFCSVYIQVGSNYPKTERKRHLTMEKNKDRTEIASDVSGNRDGIGVEIFRNNELLIEIFRDDTKLTRTVTLWKQDIPLELIEESIQDFKQNIPWDFIKY